MEIFDDGIRELRDWFREREREGKTRHRCAAGDAESGRPSPQEANPPIILKEDTHLELGHPSVGSSSATLATHDASLVESGRVTLVGPDVTEAEQGRLPFAQIAVAACDGNIAEVCSTMDRALHACAHVEGYMLRSVPDLIWARVSKEAAGLGFSLLEHGLRLVASLRNECPEVSGVEIFFVTSSSGDVSAVDRIVEPARTRLRKLQAFELKPDGTYECDSSLDCSECPEKPVCDTVREVITIRKGDRLITLGETRDKE